MTTTSTGTREEPSVSLTGLRRRRHLKHLLQTRDRLAVLATERFSHGLDDAADTFSLMIDVEDEIGDLFPEVHAALFPRWITTVAQTSHEPGEYKRRCGICAATASTPRLPRAA